MSYFKDRILTALAALAAAAMFWGLPAHGSEIVGPQQPGCGNSLKCIKAATLKVAGLISTIPGRFLPAPASLEANLAHAFASPGTSSLTITGDLTFRDRTSLAGRLKSVQELSLMTLWENKSAKIYLGVSRDGVAGINLRQKRAVPVEGRSSRVRLDEKPPVHDPYQVAPIFAHGQ